MDAAAPTAFVCSDKILARYFLRSRNGWKAKTLMLRKKVKHLGRRVTDASESRDGWKERARLAEAALVASRQEVARLLAEREGLQQALTEAQEKKARSQRTTS